MPDGADMFLEREGLGRWGGRGESEVEEESRMDEVLVGGLDVGWGWTGATCWMLGGGCWLELRHRSLLVTSEANVGLLGTDFWRQFHSLLVYNL